MFLPGLLYEVGGRIIQMEWKVEDDVFKVAVISVA